MTQIIVYKLTLIFESTVYRYVRIVYLLKVVLKK